MLGAYMKIDTTKTDCTADYAADGPALKAWMEPLQQPGIESKIIKSVLRHAFKFLAQFNEAKKTWDSLGFPRWAIPNDARGDERRAADLPIPVTCKTDSCAKISKPCA